MPGADGIGNSSTPSPQLVLNGPTPAATLPPASWSTWPNNSPADDRRTERLASGIFESAASSSLVEPSATDGNPSAVGHFTFVCSESEPHCPISKDACPNEEVCADSDSDSQAQSNNYAQAACDAKTTESSSDDDAPVEACDVAASDSSAVDPIADERYR
ncbi:hypothetical protein ATCC90586_004836 [Pythium insidiosum]|nr:hypothetical protein ATCC90586_004836 [Pythium insidiosum]